MSNQTAIKLFENKKVRSVWDGENESVTNRNQLKMQSSDGKCYKTKILMKCIKSTFCQTNLMQSICFVVLIFTISLDAFAQHDDNHLAPVDFMEISETNEYYNNLFPLLYKDFTDEPIARLAVHPTFRCEYALSVEQKSEGYYLLSNILSENYWDAGYSQEKKGFSVQQATQKKIEMISQQYEIEKSLYELIRQLFEIATSQIRKPEKRTGIEIINGEKVEIEYLEARLDGVVYYLSTTNSNGEILTGETHSPHKNTLMRRLVDICDDLYSLSQGEEIPKDGIEAKMKSLIADMQNKNQIIKNE